MNILHRNQISYLRFKNLVQLALTGLLFISACTHQMQTSFNPQEYAAYEGRGTASLYGQAFLMTRGGTVKYGAGQTIILIPVTTYTTEWLREGALQGKSTILDSRIDQYAKTTQADGEGRFVFSGVPAGQYYVACRITWESGRSVLEGGWIAKRVTLRDAQKVKIILTR